jgi:tRNA threonylcarbamoyladenosine biosynthesis protein TsaB
MILLAIDTATDACSATLWADGAVAAHRSAAMARGHAEALMPMVVEVIGAAELNFADLTGVAVTVGPGAFTGLRIGLSAARGIGLAAGIPVLGATTLEVVARAVPAAERAPDRHGANVVAAIESKRADLYVQAFGPDLAPLGAPASVMPEALAAALPGGPLVLAGDGAARAAAALDAAQVGPGRITLSTSGPHPDTRVLAALAAGRLADAARPEDMPAPEPLYLRPPDAKLPAGGGRLRP